MGNLLRLALFILVLGVLAGGIGAMLLHERQREHAVERLVRESIALPTDNPAAAPEGAAVISELRRHHARTQRAILLFGGLALGCVVVLAVVPARVPAAAPDNGHAAAARTEMRGLETLARATVAQRAELDQEREARHRAAQDLHLQQVLANHALQDKIRLGRDLHDGLIQTLYATGLMLETAAQRLAAEPPDSAAATRLIDRAKTTLNAAIRETRGTIGSLTPDALQTQSFADAVSALLDHLDCDRLRERNVVLSPDLPVFAEPARTELLQIIRESTSNALRHGGATRLEIEFAPLPDGRLRLLIRDDGRGFDPAAITRGHGLDNLAARARALGAHLDIDSAVGRGATLTLTLPAPAATPSESAV
jgi:signal transduction histidine kinase